MPNHSVNSACLQGRTSTSERPTEPSTNGAAVPEEKVAEVISGMSPEQQKQLSQIYYFLVQVPQHLLLFRRFS